MKLLGMILILVGASGCYMTYRRSVLDLIVLSKALVDDLAVLRCQICIHCRTLPEILENDLKDSVGGGLFWVPLLTMLEQSENSVCVCWENVSRALPSPLDRIFDPLGRMLPTGGEVLSKAIEEARLEIQELIRALQEQQPVKLRLAAAMSISCAVLFILVCI